MDDLGARLRTGALSVGVPPNVWEALPSIVVSRMKAEEAESISGRTGRVFEDLHFVWAALGATGATVACLVLISAIFYFAIASPAGSNRNPTVVDARFSPTWTHGYGMSFPSPSSSDIQAAAMIEEDDLVLALDAVVTREGRIAKLKVIQEPGSVLQKPTREERQTVIMLLDAISKARFQPARVSGGRVPVAVNMVWLYASLTVKAKMPEVQVMPKPRGSTSISIRVSARYALVA
jgi:hypothetical protein